MTRSRSQDVATTRNLQPDEIEGARRSLLVLGDGFVKSYPLPEQGTLTIGRSPECDVPVDDLSVSRQHARLTIGATTTTIEDLESANGVRVRDEQIPSRQPTPIGIDEMVKLGTLSIVVQQHRRSSRPRRIWNHDYLEGRLEDECARAERYGTRFALLHLRLDRQIEDAVVARCFTENLSAIDVVGVYGPREYQLILVAGSEDDVDSRRHAVERSLAACGVSVATGAAVYPADGRDPDTLLARARDRCRGHSQETVPNEPIVVNERMRQLRALAERVAKGDLFVLLLGETGVGKEVLAELVHRASPRRDGPYLRLNCGALAEGLLEAELFGYEKGAFTGADRAKPGLLETAHGGTVFLDEVGELPASTQVKLLRVLEDGEVRRVGSLDANAVDVRYISATNRDLEEEIRRGRFREDLYYRLNGISLTIPPLRERQDEIEPLARRFVSVSCRRNGGLPEPTLSREAMLLLQSYAWPGNIRELRNAVERAVLLCTGGEILPEHLPVDKMRTSPMTNLTAAREGGAADERTQILAALEACAGNQTHAAELLGISRRTLINRLQQYGIRRPRPRRR